MSSKYLYHNPEGEHYVWPEPPVKVKKVAPVKIVEPPKKTGFFAWIANFFGL